MAPSRPARAIPTSYEGVLLQGDIDRHIADPNNPHATKLAQLADITNAGSGVTGQVPTRQSDGTYLLTTPPGAAGGAPVGTAIPKPHASTGSAGVAANASREDHVHPGSTISPDDYNLVGWTADVLYATSTLSMVPGTLYFARVKLPKTTVISNIYVPISTAGAGLTSAFVAVYALDGTQLGVSADQGTAWNSAGTKIVALTAATASLPAGTTVLIAALAVGTTAPVIRSCLSTSTLNTNLANTNGYRSGTQPSLTTMPSPLVLTSTVSGASLPMFLLT